MKFRRLSAVLAVVSAMAAAQIPANLTPAAAETTVTLEVTVDFSGERRAISPYIYGINDGCSTDAVTATAIRQGGNRYSGYNWETNASNAGSDWYHSSDTYLSSSKTPAACAASLAADAAAEGAYSVATLQMCGYVSADTSGTVSESEIAPSSRWNEVVFRKNADFLLSPDLTDGVVYMDEYVNYLVETLGSASSGTGINGYCLDNEPALWSGTHARMHPNAVTCQELIEKSVSLASAVKDVDPDAELFGPCLYGQSAYATLQNASDWSTVGSGYDWFISYYLDEMAKASASEGVRLLDCLDIHNYSEAQGTCRIVNCTDEAGHTDCIEARLQAPRTFYESGYTENSWIGQWCKSSLPYLPKLQAAIDTYYPGTKLSLTEYSFGGGSHVSGAIAEADALGAFATQGVYLATVWPLSTMDYLYAGINLYTNYDGEGGCFGDTLIPSSTSDIAQGYSYASIDGTDESTLKTVISNKSLTSEQETVITISNTTQNFTSAAVYGITEDSADIQLLETVAVSDHQLTVTLPPLCVAQVVFSTEEPEVGDVDGNGIIDDIDAKLLAQYLVGSGELTAAQAKRADMNSDSTLTGFDLSLLKRKLLK